MKNIAEFISKITKKISPLLLFAVFISLAISVPVESHASSRLKDVVNFEGIRDNMLVGYGLVVGLNGTGDKTTNVPFTGQSLQSFLERLGVNTHGASLKMKNVAAVTVTAVLPPFSRNGSKIDVSVSTLGDCTNLQGGMLLATPLIGADGEAYAVAQGPLTINGYTAKGAAASVTKGVPTVGYIPNGAIVEKESDFNINGLTMLNLSLKNPDITTSNNVSNAINNGIGGGIAKMLDPGTVQVTVPESYKNSVMGLLTRIEQLTVDSDQAAKIIIDEASGTIVMGENVRIDTVAIAQGNLVVRVEETANVSQPGALAPDSAVTTANPQTKINVDEGSGKKTVIMQKGATLRELVNGLNALGVGPRDLISILETIKVAGALQADIQTR